MTMKPLTRAPSQPIAAAAAPVRLAFVCTTLSAATLVVAAPFVASQPPATGGTGAIIGSLFWISLLTATAAASVLYRPRGQKHLPGLLLTLAATGLIPVALISGSHFYSLLCVVAIASQLAALAQLPVRPSRPVLLGTSVAGLVLLLLALRMVSA